MALDLKATFGQNLQDGFAIHQHPLLTRLIALFGKDFGVPPQEIFDPLLEWPGVAVIGKQMDQTRETSNQLAEKQPCSVTVADIGCMHQDCQDQALRVNEQVSLAPEDFFSRRRSRVLGLARDWS